MSSGKQDIYSDAIKKFALQKLGHIGRPVGWLAAAAESWVARQASSVIAISATFLGQARFLEGPPGPGAYNPELGGIDEMPVRPKDNEWARAHNLAGCCVAMYAGTLGLKHDPSLLALLAQSIPPDAKLVVVSQGRDGNGSRRTQAIILHLNFSITSLTRCCQICSRAQTSC